VIIAIYVDDMIIVANRSLNDFKRKIMNRFKMKDLGEISYCLGIEILRDRSKQSIKFCQSKYVNNMLSKFKMTECKSVRTPQEVGLQLSNSMCPSTVEETNEMINVPYREAVGSLIYAMLGTRPDIAQSCSEVSRYMSNPGQTHWIAVKRILRYLKGTIDNGLVFSGSNVTLSGYTDSDWGRSIDDRRSTSGYIFMSGNCAISWKSKKQTTVALSTMEAEYMAMSDAVKEVLWLNKLQKEICDSSKLITLNVDNQSCLNFAKNPGQHS